MDKDWWKIPVSGLFVLALFYGAVFTIAYLHDITSPNFLVGVTLLIIGIMMGVPVVATLLCQEWYRERLSRQRYDRSEQWGSYCLSLFLVGTFLVTASLLILRLHCTYLGNGKFDTDNPGMFMCFGILIFFGLHFLLKSVVVFIQWKRGRGVRDLVQYWRI